MKILLKSATIIDNSSPFHNQTKDILIDNFKIVQIEDHIDLKDVQAVELPNLHISQGWFDSSVSFGEPGFEERETISNGLKSAAAGGFTSVVLNANPSSIISSPAQVDFVKTKAKNHATVLKPLGSISKNGEGQQLAELYDMHQHGAVGFYDYQSDMDNIELLKLALQYTCDFNGLVMSFPLDTKLAKSGVMHEGPVSTRLGMAGMSYTSEVSRIRRDLELVSYTGGRLHIPTISCAESVNIIRNAKSKGLKVTCSVAIHNLVLTDEALQEFDTNFKVCPPLRTEIDKRALIEGLKDGTIDMVTSDHNPLDPESKLMTFDHALFGTIGLETAFGALQSIFTTAASIDLLTKGKTIFQIDSNPIDIGVMTDLSLFSPTEKQLVDAKSLQSKSKNSCFLGYEFNGKAFGIIANNTQTIF